MGAGITVVFLLIVYLLVQYCGSSSPESPDQRPNPGQQQRKSPNNNNINTDSPGPPDIPKRPVYTDPKNKDTNDKILLKKKDDTENY